MVNNLVVPIVTRSPNMAAWSSRYFKSTKGSAHLGGPETASERSLERILIVCLHPA
jgi:hypothetical protein